MIFSTKTHKLMTWIAMVLLPAMAILYSALAPTMNLPYPAEVTASISAVDAFLGLVLGISVLRYKATDLTYADKIRKSAYADTAETWFLSNTAYDIAKWVIQVVLPGAAALYYALASTWGFSNPDNVVTIIMSIDTFLGILLDLNKTEFERLSLMAAVDELAKPY